MQIPGRRIEWHSTIDSTMFEASRLAAEGAPSGTVVGADEQTAGRGTRGRTWISEPNAGLYISVILRYQFKPDNLPVVTQALGLAAVDAIQKTTHLTADLRWPNDVLIGGRKCAGILTHLEGAAVIAGIGINVNQTQFAPELNATSLQIETKQTHSREALLAELLTAIETYCELLSSKGRKPILDLFSQASSYVRGRRVTILDSPLAGTTAGLNEAGYLLVRDDAGKTHTIIAGGVRAV